MIIAQKTKDRIFNALMEGWSFRIVRPPYGEYSKEGHHTNRGSVWISPPNNYNSWTAYKSDTDNWLNECLDEAGVK